MADTFVSVTWVADELVTSTKLNQAMANQANFHNGTALGDGIIVTRHIGSGVQIADKMSNPYKFRAYKTTASNLPDGTYTTVICDNEVFDTNNNFNSSTGVYTVPLNGFYFLQANAKIAGSVGTNFLWNTRSAIRVNATTIVESELYVYDQGRTNSVVLVSSGIFYLSANDSIDFQVLADSNTGTPTIVGGAALTNFCGFLVSRT